MEIIKEIIPHTRKFRLSQYMEKTVTIKLLITPMNDDQILIGNEREASGKDKKVTLNQSKCFLKEQLCLALTKKSFISWHLDH